MAEIKTGIFAKNVQKRLNRAQEKVGAEGGGGDGGMKVEVWGWLVKDRWRDGDEVAGGCRPMRSLSAVITITHIVVLGFLS